MALPLRERKTTELPRSFTKPPLARPPPVGPSQFLFCASNPPPLGCMLGTRPSTRSGLPGEACLPPKVHKLNLTQVSEWDDGQFRRKDDYLAAEEPLEIRVGDEPLSVTMRTPGHDLELAAGFLFTEGLVQSGDQILSLQPIAANDGADSGNVVQATLSPEAAPDFAKMRRHFFAASSCGIC